jgi:16S rRNA (uracil1498-N3)-methyltransferase
MARRLFFVDAVRRGAAELRGENARHLVRVLRVEPGQRYEISDNASRYLAEVEIARKGQVIFRVVEELGAEAPAAPVTLLAALIKFDRFEWMIEKATELGVAAIVPVEAERSEKGLARAAAKRLERWRRIVLEASQQSRRVTMPCVEAPVSFEQALITQADRRLFLDEQRGVRIPSALSPPPGALSLLVGPEGGWTDREREHASAAGWTAVWLGRQILRTETAAIAALAVVMAAAEVSGAE